MIDIDKMTYDIWGNPLIIPFCKKHDKQHDYVFHDEDGEKIEYKCRLCDKKVFEYKDEVESE